MPRRSKAGSGVATTITNTNHQSSSAGILKSIYLPPEALSLNGQVFVMTQENFQKHREFLSPHIYKMQNVGSLVICRLTTPTKPSHCTLPSVEELKRFRQQQLNNPETKFPVNKYGFTKAEQTIKRNVDGNIKTDGRSMLLGIGGELFSDEMLRSMHRTLFEFIYQEELLKIRQYEGQVKATLNDAIKAGSFGKRLTELCDIEYATILISFVPEYARRQMLLEAVYHMILATHDDFNWNQDFIANDDLWSVLQVQASKGHTEICEWLLGHGADLNFRETKGYTALAIAAASNAEETVKMLLARGANPCEVSEDQTTALHLAAALGYVDVVNILLEQKYGVSLNAVNNHSMTPLLLAVQNRHAVVVKALLESAAKQENGKELTHKMLNSGTRALWTPLHFACSHGDVAIVDLLLRAERFAKDHDVVMALPQEGDDDNNNNNDERDELVDQEWFLKGMTVPLMTPVSITTKTTPVTAATSNTALFGSASSSGSRALSQTTPSKKRSVVNAAFSLPSDQPQPQGITSAVQTPVMVPHPMTLAGGNGHTECIKVLMAHGVPVDARNPKDNTTALHSSITGKHWDTAAFLLQQGADVALPTSTGVSALMIAAGQESKAWLERIFQENERLKRPPIDVNATVNGWTAVMSAASKGRLENLQLLIKEKGGSLTNLSSNQFSLLQLAAQGGHLDVVQWLWEQTKADLNHVNTFGWTPLYCAAFYAHVSVINYLLDLGVDPLLHSRDGWTVIMLLARVGNKAELQRVLNMIPDVEVRKQKINSGTVEKWTALHSAASRNHLETVKILMENGGDILQTDARQWTPLACAIQQGHEEVVKAMLEFASANNLLQRVREVHDELKTSLMHLAAASKNCQDPEMINILLRYGFDAAPRAQFALPEKPALGMETPYFEPKSPMKLAVEYGKNKAFVDALLPWNDGEQLKDPIKVKSWLEKNPSLAISMNERGENALHLAFRGGHLETAKVLMESLREKGKLTAFLGKKPLKGITEDDLLLSPLHMAIMNREHAIAILEAIQLCMMEGLFEGEDTHKMMNVQDAKGRTPLFLAVWFGDAAWVNALINAGASITLQGWTDGGRLFYPYHLAQQLEEQAATPEEKSNRKAITALLRAKAEELQKNSLFKKQEPDQESRRSQFNKGFK